MSHAIVEAVRQWADRRCRPGRAEDVINAHVTLARRFGVQFAPWTAEGERAFLSRHRVVPKRL